MFYIGIESGSDKILKKVTKGATGQSIIKACQKAKNAGYVISCMIILGLGGKTCSKEHVDDTARVVSEVSPDYLGALTLQIEDGIREEFMTKFKESFTPIDDADALIELENLVYKINSKSPIIFRANHGSNAYPIGGTFPEDKNKVLERIAYLREHPELCRPQGFRGF